METKEEKEVKEDETGNDREKKDTVTKGERVVKEEGGIEREAKKKM